MASDRDGTGLRSLAEASASLGLPKPPTGIRRVDGTTDGGLPAGHVDGCDGRHWIRHDAARAAVPRRGRREHGEPGVLVTFVRHQPDAPPVPALGPPGDRREGGVQVTNTLRSGYTGGARRGSP
jgi:hypothetical protein